MSEVDYLQFAYKREKQNSLPSENYDRGYRQVEVEEKRSKKSKGKTNVFFVITVVFLCFCLVLLAADIFSNGKVVASISSLVRQKSYSYYFVAAKASDMAEAYGECLTVKNGGGAGYIYSDSDEVFVVYSVFCDEAEAQSVAEKNLSAEVVEVSIKSGDTFVETMDKAIVSICQAIYEYDKGTLTDSGFVGVVEEIKKQVSELSAQEKTISDKNKSSLCEYVTTGIEKVSISSDSRSAFLSGARYFVVGWVTSLAQV